MLKSYSFMHKEIDIAFYYKVWDEIKKLKWYFYKFAGVNAEEAMQRTLMHTIVHFSPSKGNLSAYVKKLAREITKNNNREVLVDFLENTLSDNNWDEDYSSGSNIDVGSIQDFSSEVINDLVNTDDNRRVDIDKLALEFMDKFVILCDALIKHDTSTKYYPDIFIQNCLKLNAKCKNFNKLCLDVYMEYGDDMRWFLELAENDTQIWREPDFTLLNSSYSKRLQLINLSTHEVVENADVEPFRLMGNLGTGASRKKIIKVNYSDLWEYFCDLIDDTETNELKFIIGNNYIIRTFGGSFSVLNADLFNLYNNVRVEILTNVIQDINGRILNIGSENLYLVCNGNMNKTEMSRTIHNHPFKLVYEDITDTIR
jgi:hypothetical protein